MRFEYKGFTPGMCECDLTVRGNVAFVKEKKGYTGTSITNAAENIANKICDDFKISRDDLIVIEHYEDYNNFSLVKFKNVKGTLRYPEWVSINEISANHILHSGAVLSTCPTYFIGR